MNSTCDTPLNVAETKPIVRQVYRFAKSWRMPVSMYLVILTAIVVRVAVLPWFVDVPPKTFDEKHYNKIAINIVQLGEFSIEPGKPTSFRPPMFAAFTVAIYGITGIENYQAVRVAQIITNVLTVVIVFYLALELFYLTVR